MKKTIIPGMFSSVSEAELATEMMDISDISDSNETGDNPAENSTIEAKKDNNSLPS